MLPTLPESEKVPSAEPPLNSVMSTPAGCPPAMTVPEIRTELACETAAAAAERIWGGALEARPFEAAVPHAPRAAAPTTSPAMARRRRRLDGRSELPRGVTAAAPPRRRTTGRGRVPSLGTAHGRRAR